LIESRDLIEALALPASINQLKKLKKNEPRHESIQGLASSPSTTRIVHRRDLPPPGAATVEHVNGSGHPELTTDGSGHPEVTVDRSSSQFIADRSSHLELTADRFSRPEVTTDACSELAIDGFGCPELATDGSVAWT
jgi:hypothetical protein